MVRIRIPIFRHLAFIAILALAALLSLGSALAEERLGQRETFWVWDLTVMPPGFRQTEAVLRAQGAKSLIYVEEKLWEKGIEPAFVERLHKRLERYTPQGSYAPYWGILSILEKLFAPLPEVIRPEKRAAVLFADLGQYKNHQFDGFFNPFDQLTEAEAAAQGQHSNERNLIYINGFRQSEEYTTGVIAHELQHLLAHHAAQEGEGALWLSEVLGEAAMLVSGYYTDQGHANRFAQSPERFPLVSHSYVQYGPQLLFASYLLDSMPSKERGLQFLTRAMGRGREAVEEFFRSQLNRPVSFDIVFSNFIGYLFENEGRRLPHTLVGNRQLGLTAPSIPPYATLESFPAELSGSLMPYSFLAVDLPETLPATAVVQVEVLRDGAKEGSCARNGSVLWKPIHSRRIAIYSVGCEHKGAGDELKFRLRVLDKPLPHPVSRRKIAL